MFQVESRAQMSALPRNRPEHFYDLVVQVGHHPPWTYRGQNDAPVYEAKTGQGRGHLRAPTAGTGAETHARSSALSGTTNPDVHDRGQF